MAEEKNFENKIKDYLKSKGCYFLKYWSGNARNGMKFTKDGVPDILCSCNGRFLGIEVKATHGKPSELQIENLKDIHNSGGYAILLYPKDFDLFKRFVDALVIGTNNNKILEMYEIFVGRWAD